MLRHADVAVTAAHYLENKQRSVLGFAHLLKDERTIVPIGSGSFGVVTASAVLGRRGDFRQWEHLLGAIEISLI